MLKERIVQYTTKMEPIRIYDSIREAEGEYHIPTYLRYLRKTQNRWRVIRR